MTNRLSFWFAASVVTAVAAAALLLGPTPAALLGLLHVPMLLAVLLLARAVVLRIRGRDAALRIGERAVLGGWLAIVVPLGFLVAWTALRETGVVNAELCAKRRSLDTTTISMPWTTVAPDHVIPEEGLVVTAPEGVFGDAFKGELRRKWSFGDGGRIHGEVKLAGDEPSSWLPLRKSADVKHHVAVTLQLHGRDGSIRSSSIEMDVKAACEVLGIASRRDFQGWIGKELGEDVGKAIDALVQKARDS